MTTTLESVQIPKAKKTVVVVPEGGPGMPEMLKPKLGDYRGRAGKDGGINYGRAIQWGRLWVIDWGHIVAETQEGGEIALVKNGDTIVINRVERRVDLRVAEGGVDEKE